MLDISTHIDIDPAIMIEIDQGVRKMPINRVMVTYLA